MNYQKDGNIHIIYIKIIGIVQLYLKEVKKYIQLKIIENILNFLKEKKLTLILLGLCMFLKK